MKNILHITPHLGGGVGTVLLNWLSYDKNNSYSIVTLDYANSKSLNICKENNIKIYSEIPVEQILSCIKESDITVIHFWNHPLLYDFLIRNPLPESRIIIWAHVSGAKPPYVFNKKLLQICDKFVYTTPISYEYFENNSKISCILSTGGVDKYKNIMQEEHQGYNVGYIGTVDFAKMHPEYAETLTKTNADKIYVVGGDNEKEIFKNADKRFIVTGKLTDISPVLKQLDIFAYLLNPNHYGTAEQVIQETMSAGIVPIVLNNPCERSLITHMETGLVANNLDEYIKYVNMLKANVKLRKNLAMNAKKYAIQNFSLKTLIQKWQQIFDEIILLKKTAKKWEIQKNELTSYDIFLESLGEYAYIFENKTNKEINQILKQPEWSSKTKGTPYQYYEFLHGDKLYSLLNSSELT